MAVAAALVFNIGSVGAQPDPPDSGPVEPSTPVPITPACPDTGGSADIDRRGGSAIGTCWGNAAQAPGYEGVSSATVWNWYGCDQWRSYSPGSRVSSVDRVGDVPLLLEDVVANGLDPTVVYHWYTVECEHHSVGPDGEEVVELWGWGLLIIETTTLSRVQWNFAPPFPDEGAYLRGDCGSLPLALSSQVLVVVVAYFLVFLPIYA